MAYMFYDADAFNTMPVGWDTSKVTASGSMFTSADTWTARFTGGGTSTLPGSEWTRIEDACDASYPPLNGDVGNCTDTLMSGTSCVPTCDAGYVLKGVTSCTDRVLTEDVVCVRQFTDRAELKATVDACLGCGAVWGDVLLLGQVVLASRPGDEAVRRRWMRGHA